MRMTYASISSIQKWFSIPHLALSTLHTIFHKPSENHSNEKLQFNSMSSSNLWIFEIRIERLLILKESINQIERA